MSVPAGHSGSSRAIRLRRPATLSVQEGVFVPRVDSHRMEEIERRWTQLCESNPVYFDGRLYHVLGVHRNGHGGAVLHVMDCAYRFFAVQDESFDLGVRALGVKGVVERDGRYLLGRRSPQVAAYQGLWEFAPSGSVEPGSSPEQIISRELREETGLECAREPVSMAVLFDPVLRCWEMVFSLQIRDAQPALRTTEYSELEWRVCGGAASDLPADLSPIARQIASLLAM